MTGVIQKHAIVRALGESRLLIPDLVTEAIAANARLKYYLSLLQLARLHADQPDTPLNDLHLERARCDIDDASLDEVVSNARLDRDENYRIPGLKTIAARIDEDLAHMLEPLRVASLDAEATAAFEARSRAVSAVNGVGNREAIDRDTLAGFTSMQDRPDSLHRLVMDLHKALNHLEAQLASESIAGARAAGVTDADRTLVTAFMEGLNATAPLKLNHPGLTTTATRSGNRLVIENDVGATEAHVFVIQVEGLRAIVTTTDVHVQRLDFFRSLFDGFTVVWDDTAARREPTLAADQLFYLSVGTYEAASQSELASFLKHVGSRLVFLIDWNRARKQLRNFLPNADCITLLRSAVDAGYGHRGFLEAGGADLIFGAMTVVMRSPFRFGERLDEILGRDQTVTFLQFAMREAAEGIVGGRSQSLIRERIYAELAERAPTARARLLGLAVTHAVIVLELARSLAADIAKIGSNESVDTRAATAATAKHREHQADDIVRQMRGLVDRIPMCAPIGRLIEIADDAADVIEEGIFLLSLLPAGPIPEPLRSGLGVLGTLIANASDAYRQSLVAAHEVRCGASRDKLQGFLSAIDSVVAAEHDTDDAQRRALSELLSHADLDARVMFVFSQVTDRLEEAADALMHATLALRDEVMGVVMTHGW